MQPRFRQDLDCVREEDQGVVFYRVDDVENQSSFRIYEIEYIIAQKLDGKRSLQEIIDEIKAEYEFEIQTHDLEKFIKQLESRKCLAAAEGDGVATVAEDITEGDDGNADANGTPEVKEASDEEVNPDEGAAEDVATAVDLQAVAAEKTVSEGESTNDEDSSPPEAESIEAEPETQEAAASVESGEGAETEPTAEVEVVTTATDLAPAFGSDDTGDAGVADVEGQLAEAEVAVAVEPEIEPEPESESESAPEEKADTPAQEATDPENGFEEPEPTIEADASDIESKGETQGESGEESTATNEPIEVADTVEIAISQDDIPELEVKKESGDEFSALESQLGERAEPVSNEESVVLGDELSDPISAEQSSEDGAEEEADEANGESVADEVAVEADSEAKTKEAVPQEEVLDEEATEKSRKKLWLYVGLGAIVVLATGLFAAAYSTGYFHKPLMVNMISLKAPISWPLMYNTLRNDVIPEVEVEQSFTVPGTIGELLAEVGDEVREGQVLMRLLWGERDEKRYQKFRQEYFRFFEKYKAAQQLLDAVGEKIAPFETELKGIEDRHKAMRAKAKRGEGNLDKKKLREFAREKMKLKKRLKRFYRKRKSLEKSQKTVERKMTSAKKQLDTFEEKNADSFLRASINGYVGQIYMKKDSSVTPETLVMQLINDDNVRLSFRLEERKEFDENSVVRLLVGKDEYFEGKVLASRLPRGEESVVDILVPRHGKSLDTWRRAGLVRTVQENVFTLPTAAMRTNDIGQIMIYRFEAGKAAAHLIEAIEVGKENVRFSSPHNALSAGDEVILEPVDSQRKAELVEGAVVQYSE